MSKTKAAERAKNSAVLGLFLAGKTRNKLWKGLKLKKKEGRYRKNNQMGEKTGEKSKYLLDLRFSLPPKG